MVTERLASQCLTYFIDSKVEIAASSACRMICGISPRCQLAFQNPGAGLTIVWFLWVFLGCLFFQHLPGWCVCGPLVAQHSTDRSHLYPRLMAKRGPKAGSTGIFPPSLASNNTFNRAGLLACRSELLSHAIVFWAFCKAENSFPGEITMEGYGSSRTGPPRDRWVPAEARWPLCGQGPRKPTRPHGWRMHSLLQYFLSIHCGHSGKGWVTMQEKCYISCLFAYSCAATATLYRLSAIAAC